MESSKPDTIKFCLSLLNKLKNHEPIDITNKLINVGIGAIPSSHLKLLIQAESYNNHTLHVQSLQEIERKTQIIARDGQHSREEQQTNTLIQLKLKTLILMKEMRSNDINLSMITGNQLLTLIQTPEQMQFVLRLLFKIDCLYVLQTLAAAKITSSKLDQVQQETLLYMATLVKLVHHPAEAKEILLNQLKGKYKKEQVEREKKSVLAVIKMMLEKEKDLLKVKRPQMAEKNQQDRQKENNTKKLIRNKLLNQYKIDLDNPSSQVQQHITALDQNAFLLVSPLYRFYQETNPKVLQILRQTKLSSKLNYNTKPLNESFLNNSPVSKSKSNIKVRYIKNPDQYRKYLKLKIKNCQTYSKECAQGEYFVKHNFNNLNSALKFVVFNRQRLLWAKNKVQMNEDSTKVKIKNIVGVLYGKVSARLQEETDSDLCFSIVMKDRTLDLSKAKDKQDLALKRFIMGASSIINSYHSAEKERILAEKRTITDKTQKDEISEKIAFHEYKVQTITQGKLLWRDLFNSFSRKSKRFDQEIFNKPKYLIYFANQQALAQRKLSLAQSASKKLLP